MSLILDALNKADRERKKNDEAPGLDTVYQAPPEEKSEFEFKNYLYYGIGALFIGLLVVVFFLGRSSGTNEGSATQTNTNQPKPIIPQQAVSLPSNNIADKPVSHIATSSQTTLSQTTATPQTATAQTQKPQSRPNNALPATPSSANLNQNKNSQTSESPSVTKDLAKPSPSEAKQKIKEQRRQQGVTNLYSQKNKDKPIPDTPSQSAQNNTTEPDFIVEKLPEPTPAKSTPPAPSRESSPDVMSIRDLPWSVQENIPTLMYSEHNYNGGSNSSVKLNNTVHRKGAKIANEVYIDQILSDGIILRHKSYKFKMKALSSWVNM